MTKFDRSLTNIVLVCLVITIIIATSVLAFYATSKITHAEGATFVTVLRQAGRHSVYISSVASEGYSYSGWGVITDLTDSYVCVKENNLTCFPLDKVISVRIGDVDSLPGGGS